MSQLFPVKVRHTMPSPFPSADLNEFAVGDDGMDYAVKKGIIAACESLCYKIFSACSIGVPQSAILQMPDGTLAFGSRVIVDRSFDAADPAEKIDWAKSCGDIMSSICGLDFMIANEDRHIGNFLFITLLNNRKSCVAIDFSRALLYNPWPLPEVWNTPNNTSNMVLAKKNLGTWNSSSATQSLLNLSAVKSTTWESWVDELPSEWIDGGTKFRLIQWWGSSEFQSRLQKCMMAVK